MNPAWAAVLALLLCSARGSAAAEDDFDLSEYGHTAIPILGYDDKTGWLFGAAGFIYSDEVPGVNAGLFVVSNLGDFHSGTLNYAERSKGPWSLSLHLLGERAFDHYYGEGDLTTPEESFLMRMEHFEVRPGALFRVRPHLRIGAFVDLRVRREEESSRFPDEVTSAAGLEAQWDTRDKLINTRRGDFAQFRASRMPWGGAFSQLELDLRRFIRLSRRWTWGQRFIGGTSLGGQPSYLFRYSLGGLDLLRGYKSNRFRGGEYFVVQEEARRIVNKWLSLNASVDIGAIRDDAYHQLKLSGQIGLRLGLPPDWGQKMRVDFGFGADQATFQIQFGEIF